ncbi:threonylcarbamoyladenosine tRNA methylthiotransferase MtaB [Tindallia magadiensis]|uniref:Threonylcarbamoyladenosine tRNA methylthiotransferase MtaB n=1 Tax=Tindallia magadiensis TaxID=69895 RepID=A0A1I3B6Y4_9FIRM|nr:tRNA (N(6)-L-threonylcarbamoyladenosine(37)-C(2))-methylthiotransferase MtaB [Tindallia magadiensis]SFH57461.1 threonylcarbamoyladenosine tRNA methylthiotransferase MtaB [Tindallia magadiensis]
MKMNTVAISTLGCKVNQYETQAMLEIFEKKGYQVVDEKEKADVFVINTCTVTNTGDRKSRQLIRRALKNNPKAIIAVVGCYSQLEPDEVKEIKGVHVVLGTQNRSKIVEAVEEAAGKERPSVHVEDYQQQHQYEAIGIDNQIDKTRAYVKIQDGCDQYCSYCIIPYARGPVRSREEKEILHEVTKLVQNGYQEIVLTGIHLTSYGKDRKEPEALFPLIEKINAIPDLLRIRLGSLDPFWFKEDTIKKLMQLDKLCPHFHLSLQSGSDDILKKMARRYTTKDYWEIVSEIRRWNQNAAITTDIITGFPGETDADFHKTCQFIKDIEFSQVHIFKYSPRRGTKAAKDPNQISDKDKNKRSEILHEIVRKSRLQYMKKFMNQQVNVLFERYCTEGEDWMIGHTAEYLQVKALLNSENIKKIVPVTVTDIKKDFLIGSPVKNREKPK